MESPLYHGYACSWGVRSAVLVCCYLLDCGVWIMKINCIHCAYPLAPDGLCRRCGEQQEPHSGTWPEYYKEESRFLEPFDTGFFCLCIVTLLIVFISLLSLV